LACPSLLNIYHLPSPGTPPQATSPPTMWRPSMTSMPRSGTKEKSTEKKLRNSCCSTGIRLEHTSSEKGGLQDMGLWQGVAMDSLKAKVSLGPAMPNPSMLCGWATPETAVFRGGLPCWIPHADVNTFQKMMNQKNNFGKGYKWCKHVWEIRKST
jgi:hypothetical protein